MTSKEKTMCIQYLANRRIEQINDNIADPACKATEENFTAHGVDYHVRRKAIARYLISQMLNPKGYYKLTNEGSQFLQAILNTGVTRQTVVRWLRKYEKFRHTFFIIGG